ncbi:MAG: Spy/CpxP family protein refolding chaperone [Candidatus Syntrophosphaera sp.]|nr:Spy/CpxP family protein refolding chaperone [Candidatus Syntrophosphaera sp.]
MKKIIVITLATLLLAGMLFAQAKTEEPPATNPKLKPRLVDDGTGVDRHKAMNLTEAQQKQLDELRLSHQKNMNSIDAEIKNLQLDIDKAIKNEDFATAKKLNQQMHEKRLNRSNAQISHKENVMKELTAEQKKVFTEDFGRMMGFEGRMGYYGLHGDRHPGMMGRMQDGEKNPMQVYRHMKQMRSRMQDCEDCDNHKSKNMPESKAPKAKK